MTLITILGLAIIAVGLFWTGKYFSHSGAAEVTGVKVNLPAGFFVTIVGILVVLFPYSSWYKGQDSSEPTATTDRLASAAATAAPPLPSSTTLNDTAIKFTSPKPNSANPPRVGRKVSVIGTGKVPEGKHLWIFVYTADQKLYYTSGEATVFPDSWNFSGAVLGGNAPGDVNALYTIYAVLADSNAHTTIETAFKKNQGTVGTREVPGESGSEKVAYLTVKRVK